MPPKATRSNVIAAPAANEIAINTFRLNEIGISQPPTSTGQPSLTLNRTTTADRSDSILEALAKIQATVTDIALRQEDIFRRLNVLEGLNVSENLEFSAPFVNNDHGEEVATHARTSAQSRDPLTRSRNYRGLKRKADNTNHGSGNGARVREAQTDVFNNDVSFLGRGREPVSDTEEAQAMRLTGVFDENQRLQRLEDQQRRVDEVPEYPNSGHDLESYPRPTLHAPNELRIVSEVRENFMHEFGLSSYLAILPILSYETMFFWLTLNF